jgi:hypothetical protein
MGGNNIQSLAQRRFLLLSAVVRRSLAGQVLGVMGRGRMGDLGGASTVN